MTDITLVPITGAHNLSAINNNFSKVQEAINNDVLNLDGGNNVMQQDLDMNGNQLLNIGVDVNNPQSLLTVAAGDSRYYNVSGDTLTGPMSVNGQTISGLAAAIASTSPLRKGEFDDFVSTLTSTAGAFQQDGIGAVLRTYQDKMRDQISVEDFGAVAGYLVTNNGPAFRAAFAAAVATGKTEVHAKGWMYLFQDELMEIPDGVSLVMAGTDYWDTKGAFRPRKMEKGTTLLMCGTPSNFVTVQNVSNMMVAGGVILNDDYATESMAGNQFYSLLNYTNNDSVDHIPATPKQLKVGWMLGNDSHLVSGRVQLNYNGVDGYNSVETLPDFPEYTVSYPGLGDNYDIGVMSKNVMFSGVHDCQIVGYWRMAARAYIASNYGDGRSFGGCVFNDTGNNFFQGYNGYSCRGNDVHRITALTTSTVEVPWNSSHTVPTSGNCYLGGTPYAYTSTAKVGDKIVLSGFSIDPSTKTTVGAECFFGTNPGFSGSSISGFITGLGHFTNRRAYDPYLTTTFPNPSKAFEQSGAPLRDIDHYNCHFFDTDVIGFLHDSLHTSFVACYAEAQGYAGGVPGQAKGARFIVSARPDLPAANGQYPAGNCSGMSWDATSEMSDGSVDLFPVHRSATSRFVGATNYCMPDSFLFDQIGYWPQQWDSRRRFDHGPRLWTGGPSNDLALVDQSLNYQQYWNASNQRIGFGTNSPQVDLHKVGATAVQRLETNVAGVDPVYQWTNTLGTWSLRPQASSINQMQFRFGSTVLTQINQTNGTIWSGTNSTSDLGTTTVRFKDTYSNRYFIGTTTVQLLSGTGTPEGTVSAPVGSLFQRNDGGASTTLYVKQSGTGNTGWVAK